MTPADLDAYAAELEERLQDTAQVIRDDDWPAGVMVRPVRAGAAPFSWHDGGQWLVFQVGDHCRWELDPDDTAAVRTMVEAVIAGAGHEVTGPGGRHRVVLTLPHGRHETQTTYEGCLPALLPLPFWPRWSPTTHFQPYSQVPLSS